MNDLLPHAIAKTAAKSRRRTRALLFQAWLAAAIVLFLVLAALAAAALPLAFDVPITRALQSVHVGAFDGLMRALSWIGFMPQAFLITLAVIVGVYLAGLKWESAVLAFSVIGSSLLGTAIKVIVERPRPTMDLVQVVTQLTSYSFPSGHVLYFTTFFGFLFFLAFTLLAPSWRRAVALIALGGMIALIGISRIYLGQHWASDVLAAYLLGSVWLSFSILVYRWGKRRRSTA